MIPVAIFGTSKMSAIVCQIIEKLYNPIISEAGGEPLDIVALVHIENSGVEEDEIFRNKVCLSFQDFVKMYKHGVIPIIILPREILVGQTMLITELIKAGIGIDSIYLTGRNSLLKRDSDIISYIQPYLSAKYLPYLEYHVTDHCNLNCVACEHYAGLVKQKKFTDFARFQADLERLKVFIDDLGVIRIMGGEPLLHEELEKFIVTTRKVYPYSDIYVVTNALLIMSMPESLFETMKENRVKFHISFYMPLKDKMNTIVKYIKDRGVEVNVSKLMDKFRTRQLLEPLNNAEQTFYNCLQAHCNNIYEGKMAACFMPFTTKYFNGHFGTKLPEDGSIDLFDEDLTSEVLVAKLLLPFERCRYCSDGYKEIEWRIIQHPSTLEDWIMADNE